MYDMNFIEACSAGLSSFDDLDDYIEAWHEWAHKGEPDLGAFLGISEQEYGLWLRTGKNSVLLDIINGSAAQGAKSGAEKTPHGARAVPA